MLLYLYPLVLYGDCFSSSTIVYYIDDITGALEISHQMTLSEKDYSGKAGAVECLRWSPDGCCVAVTYANGGLVLWSVFGSLLMCTLSWTCTFPVGSVVSHSQIYQEKCKRFFSS